MSKIIEGIEESFPDETFLYPTGYEDCVVGVEMESRVIVMDANKIVEKLVKDDGLSREEAIEHFEYNISGSKGEGYPIYVQNEPL